MGCTCIFPILLKLTYQFLEMFFFSRERAKKRNNCDFVVVVLALKNAQTELYFLVSSWRRTIFICVEEDFVSKHLMLNAWNGDIASRDRRAVTLFVTGCGTEHANL